MYAQRMMELFSPYPTFRGNFPKETVPDPEKDGKLKADRKVDGIHAAWDVSHWQQHIDGVERFGGAPLRLNGTLRFAAMDIDNYIVKDHEALAKRLSTMSKNFILCRSKSGGKHLYFFFSEDASAKKIRNKCYEILGVLGLAGNEIFPKADKLHVDKQTGKNNVGNWINLPYFDAEKTLQYAWNPETIQTMTLAEFIEYGETHKFTEKDFLDLKLIDSTLFKDGPPCLQTLFAGDKPNEFRNQTLMNVSVYLKAKHLSDFKQRLFDFNRDNFATPMGEDEVNTIYGSAKRGTYTYQCSGEPICRFCDRKKCQTRKFGINADSTFPFVESLIKYSSEPPRWWVLLDGGIKVDCTTDELANPRLFQRVCLEQANMVTPIPKQGDWTKYLHGLMEKLEIVDVPKEETDSGLLLQTILNFFNTKAAGDKEEEVLQDKVVRKDNKFIFTLDALLRYLKKHHFTIFKTNQVTFQLRELGAESIKIYAKGTSRICYSLHENDVNIQTEAFTPVAREKLTVI